MTEAAARERSAARPGTRGERAALSAGWIAVLAVALWRRLPGLDPPALFPDDVWVAFLVRFAGPLDLLTYNASVPMGFVALEKPFAWLDADPERGLQWLPLACAVATLPVLGRLVRHLTGSAALGLLAAALLAVDPLHLDYATRVKQFGSDALVVTALLAAGLPLLAQEDTRRHARFAAAALAGALVSWVSVLPAALLVNAAALGAVTAARRRGRPWPRARLAVALAFDAALLAYALLRLRYQTRPELDAFWAGSYLPLDSVAAATRFLADTGARVVADAFPPGLGPIGAAAAALGLAALLARRETRGVGLVLAALPAALLAASAARLYPLGGRRTDLFLHPFWIALALVGVRTLGTFALRAWPRARPLLAAAPIAAALALLAAFPRPASTWARSDDARLLAQLEAMRRPGDALVLGRSSAYAYAYYGTDPVEPVFERSRTRKATIRPLRPDVALVAESGPPFPSALLEGRSRVFLLLTFPQTATEQKDRVAEALARAGFSPSGSIAGGDTTALLVFERAE